MHSANLDGVPEAADLILDKGHVLCMDALWTSYPQGAVAIRGEEIVAVGPRKDVLAHYSTAQRIDCSGCAVIPGLVNAHTHLPMSLLRGLADDLRLDVWLHGYILPVEQHFVDPDFCYLGTQLACAELIRGGVTCFADMYYFEHDVARAAAEAGMRGVCAETIMKFPTPDAPDYETSLRYVADLVDHWQGHELIVPAIAPHSLYMCTETILNEIQQLAVAKHSPILIHISETEDEVQNWVAGTGSRPLVWLHDHGLLEVPSSAAHCVHVSEEEIRIMRQHQVGVAHNPTSNLKLASGIAPVANFLRQDIAVGIGTDGAASNNDLDMFEELRLAALLPKALGSDPTAVPARIALAMATSMGARSLHLDSAIGSLEVGKRADVAVVRMQELHQLPHYETTDQNSYSRLVYASKSQDVRDVVINGQLVLRDGKLLTIDQKAVLSEINAVASDVTRFFIERETNVFGKLVAIGGQLELHETYEVQAKGVIKSHDDFLRRLEDSGLEVLLNTSRDQYDVYFFFADARQGRLRYREDNVLRDDGSIEPIYTLTLVGLVAEAEYEHGVILSRSRFTANADRSLRFYREYFKPEAIREIAKHRERYHIRYQGTEFAVNIDTITQPAQDAAFLEIKSRTWSQQDAVRKAAQIGEMLAILGAHPDDMRTDGYIDLLHD